MNADPLHYLSIAELARRLRAGETDPVTLAEHFLERIDALDARLGALRPVTPERALAQARAARLSLEAGVDLGPLHGIPYVAKDLYDVAGLATTAGTHVLEDDVKRTDSTVVRRLHEAGMVLLGKTVTVQFAYGGAGINHDHGTPHNPWSQIAHLPGGSSSGSGVAVAAGLAPMGLGTDTGGSVRIPASFCGITGLKTTVGRVSRAGIYPLSWSLDSAGPLTRTAEDAALVYQAIRGPDLGDDSTAGVPHDLAPLAYAAGVRGLRLAFAEGTLFEDVDPEVEAAVRACGDVLAGIGASVGRIDFEEADEARRLNPRGLVIAAEAYAVNRRLVEERSDELDPIVATRMANGRDVSAADYLQTTLEWKSLRARTVEAMRDVDALLCPTVMVPPLPVADADRDMDAYTEANLACLRNTAIGNILDLCGLTVPCGFTRDGLPIGLMIYGKPFAEETVLRVGHAYQQATDWHRRTPDLAWAGAAA